MGICWCRLLISSQLRAGAACRGQRAQLTAGHSSALPVPPPAQTVSEPPLWSPQAQHEGTGCWLQPREVRRLQMGSTRSHQRCRRPTTAPLPAAISPAGTKPSKGPRAGPSRCCLYCWHHHQAPDSADLQHTCHQEGEPQPPSTRLPESFCTQIKARLLTRVPPLPFFFFSCCCCCFAPTEQLSTSARLPAAAAGPAPRLGLGQGSAAGSLPPQPAGPGAAQGLLLLIPGQLPAGLFGRAGGEHVGAAVRPPSPLGAIGGRLQGHCGHRHLGTGLSV